jgi:hypothetical protein
MGQGRTVKSKLALPKDGRPAHGLARSSMARATAGAVGRGVRSAITGARMVMPNQYSNRFAAAKSHAE